MSEIIKLVANAIVNTIESTDIYIIMNMVAETNV